MNLHKSDTGVGVGSVVWALASISGIAVLLEKSVVAFTICKLVGAVYLGYWVYAAF